MYADTTIGGPTPTDTTEQADMSRLESVANTVVSALKSKQAKLLYRTAFTALVVGVVATAALSLHTIVRAGQASVNALSIGWWTSQLAMLLIVQLLVCVGAPMKWSCKRQPRILHISFSTSSWCNVQAAHRVWDWSALRSV